MLNKAAKGFTWLLVVRMLSRIIDFILNVLVLRDIDPATYGLTTNLGLVTTFSLFYLKQCLKQAYQRNTIVNEIQIQSAMNMMILGMGPTLLMTPIVLLILTYGQSGTFTIAASLFALSACIEGCCEPLIVPLTLEFKYGVIAKAESIAMFIKTIILYVLITQIDPLAAFGLSQLVCALIQLIYLYIHSQHGIKLNKIENTQTYVLQGMKNVGYQFTLMAFMKFTLQELEKIVMVIFNNPQLSGEFSLVSHIGAYVPRFIYAPLEEISYNLFPKISKDEQLAYLIKTLKLLNLIGITILFAGIPCAEIFLGIYGQQWVTPTCIQALQMYCIYEWIMGLNGITESYVNSTMDVKDMSWYRYCLIGQTMIYCILIMVLIDMGACGIILANILSMLLRIGLSIYLIFSTLGQFPILPTIPKYWYLYFIGITICLFYQGYMQFIVTAIYYGGLGLMSLYGMKSDITSFIK